MIIKFDCRGNDKQFEASKYWIDNSVIDIVYGGSKGSGKSCLGTSLICGDALIYPGTHYFIARKVLNDLRKYTIPSIEESIGLLGATKKHYSFNASDNVFTFYNGSKVYLIAAKYEPSDPLYTRFGSMQMTRGMIEEAGEFEEAAKNNLHAAVGRWKNDVYNINGKIIQTCNPAKNYLYKNYYKKAKDKTLEPWIRFVQALPTDNKRLPDGYLENLDRILSPSQKARLLFGQWEYDDDPTALCQYDDILQIFENNHLQKTPDGKRIPGKKYLTADIARMGSDRAIIAVWDGWIMVEVVILDKSRTTEIQNIIEALRTKHQIPKNQCVADEDGVGGGVVDNCRIEGFVNNSTPLDEQIGTGEKERPNYYNLQSQCGYHLANKINSHELFIECDLSEEDKESIVEELEQLKSFNADNGGKLRILPKEQIKQNIGRSPDWRDVLLMRYYFELKPKNKAPKTRLI